MLAIIMWEIFFENEPFAKCDTYAQFKKLLIEKNERPDIPENYASDLMIPKKKIDPIVKIIKEAWDSNPESRPSAEKIITVLTGDIISIIFESRNFLQFHPVNEDEDNLSFITKFQNYISTDDKNYSIDKQTEEYLKKILVDKDPNNELDIVTKEKFAMFVDWFIPAADFMQNFIEICSEKWFFGLISREEANNYIRRGGFLVRLSSKTTDLTPFIISFCDGKKEKHFSIKRSENSGLSVIYKEPKKPIKGGTLKELIEKIKRDSMGKLLKEPCPYSPFQFKDEVDVKDWSELVVD